MTDELNRPEPAPVSNDKPAVWDLVVADMRDRDAEGRRKYGTPLQSFNGRRPLIDAYQEALDLVVYMRQEIEEAAALRAEVEKLRGLLKRAVGEYRDNVIGAQSTEDYGTISATKDAERIWEDVKAFETEVAAAIKEG